MNTPARDGRWFRMLLPFACMLIVIGARYYIPRHYGAKADLLEITKAACSTAIIATVLNVRFGS